MSIFISYSFILSSIPYNSSSRPLWYWLITCLTFRELYGIHCIVFVVIFCLIYITCIHFHKFNYPLSLFINRRYVQSITLYWWFIFSFDLHFNYIKKSIPQPCEINPTITSYTSHQYHVYIFNQYKGMPPKTMESTTVHELYNAMIENVFTEYNPLSFVRDSGD